MFIMLNVVFLAFFLIQYTSFINTSFDMQGLEERARGLLASNERMGMDLFNRTKLSSLDSLANALEFEKTDTVHYISTVDREVAANID